MKGTFILTEGRSGSNWLASLANRTGQLGTAGEWFADWYLQGKQVPDKEHLVRLTLEAASTPNGYFNVKLFPAHIHAVHRRFNFDVIKYFRDNFDINFIYLTRQDRFRQAISFARGIQTQKWVSSREVKRDEHYDFAMIARCFFMISSAYQYWESYIELYSMSPTRIVYEDMLKDPRPFVDCLADHCGVSIENIPESKHSIQRDSITEAWLDRFKSELQSNNVVPYSAPSRPHSISISNLRRFVSSRQMKPYPFTY